MEHCKDWGLSLAKSLNFTDAQFEEAHKRVESPENASQLLVALLDVSRTKQQQQQQQAAQQHQEPHQLKNHQHQHQPVGSDISSTSSTPHSFSTSNSSLNRSPQQEPLLRQVFVDGSNVARSHGRDGAFSWQGIRICVHWFASRGHRVKVFVPAERCREAPPNQLSYLRADTNALVETPTGCNDDMFVIEAARHNNGVIVSNDMFRDEKRRLRDDLQTFVDLNRLPYVFVDDLFLPASDPRGRLGPHLEEFLSEQQTGSQHSLNRRLSAPRHNFRFQKNCLINLNQQHHHKQQAHRTSSMVFPAASSQPGAGAAGQVGPAAGAGRGPGRRALCSTKSHFI